MFYVKTQHTTQNCASTSHVELLCRPMNQSSSKQLAASKREQGLLQAARAPAPICRARLQAPTGSWELLKFLLVFFV